MTAGPHEPLDTVRRAETPEGIALTLRPAGLVARCQAWMIDFLIRVGLFIVASIVAGLAGGLGAAFGMIAFFLLEWGYPVAFELARGGATPGKRALGLKVVMDSGLPVTPGASLVRNLLRAADFLPFLYMTGSAMLLARPDGKRLGDLAAGTLVVYAEPARLHAAIPAADPQRPAQALSPAQQTAVVEWAGRIPRLTPARAEELARLARPAVAEGDGGPVDAPVAPRLLAVAHWVLGHRGAPR